MKKILFLFLLLPFFSIAQKKVAAPTVTWVSKTGKKIKRAPLVIPYKGPKRLGGKLKTAPCGGSRIVFNPPGDDYGVYIDHNDPVWFYPVGPHDTIVLGSGHKWSYFSMHNYAGDSAKCPIVITNDNGQTEMTAGIELLSDTAIKVTGSGNGSIFYGLYVNKVVNNPGDPPGVQISVQGRSCFLDIERVFGKGGGYGAWIKQDPTCADTFMMYPYYKIHDIHLHDCKFINVGQDVVYAGGTDPFGLRDYFCFGGTYHFIFERLKNIEIDHLIIDSAGRTGIQMSGADEGNNSIHDCTITRTGFEWNQSQGTAISIGGMTDNCHVYNNTTSKTFLYGILSFGVGTNFIEGNHIDSCGFLAPDPYLNKDSIITAHPELTRSGNFILNSFSQPSCIYIDTRNTTNAYHATVNNMGKELDSSRFVIRNNTLGRDFNNTSSIFIYESYNIYHTRNVVCGNTGTVTSVFLHQRADQDPVPRVDILTDCSIPYALAGSDQSISLATAGLNGNAIPTYTHSVTAWNWQKISGPGTTTIVNNSSQIAKATGLVDGTYVFRLTVTQDDTLTATDDVVVTVSGTSGPAPTFMKIRKGVKIKTF